MMENYLRALRASVGDEKYPLAFAQLRGLGELLKPEMRRRLVAAGDNEERIAFLNKWCGDYAAREVKNAVAVMGERGELDFLDEIAAPDSKMARVEAVVTTARSLTSGEKEWLKKELEEFAADAEIIFREDKDLIGGVKIRIGDREFDNSLKARLEACFA